MKCNFALSFASGQRTMSYVHHFDKIRNLVSVETNCTRSYFIANKDERWIKSCATD